MTDKVKLSRDDTLATATYAALAKHHATLDETIRVAGSLIGWSLHQSSESLDFKLEAVSEVAREIRRLLIRNNPRDDR